MHRTIFIHKHFVSKKEVVLKEVDDLFVKDVPEGSNIYIGNELWIVASVRVIENGNFKEAHVIVK